jgi:CBS domain-containing protein
MRVRDVMTRNPVCCTADTPIYEAACLMQQHDCGAIPVVGDLIRKLPVGIVTDRDIVTRTIAAGRNPMTMTVRDCMTSPAVTVVDDTRVHDCVELLELSQIRRVIVVDDGGSCCGIVSQADIALHASKREAGDLVREVSKPNAPAFVAESPGVVNALR